MTVMTRSTATSRPRRSVVTTAYSTRKVTYAQSRKPNTLAPVVNR